MNLFYAPIYHTKFICTLFYEQYFMHQFNTLNLYTLYFMDLFYRLYFMDLFCALYFTGHI